MASSSLFTLTPELKSTVCAFIVAGAFPHVACEAAGVPWEVFERWLTIGSPINRKRGWKPHKSYTPLWCAVMQAKAQARLRAEMAALSDDPVAWLKSGPGKDKPNNPGWSSTIRPQLRENNTQVNVLLSPEMQGIFASILQVLAPHPEARAAVAEALADGQSFAGKPQRKQVELLE